MTSDDELLKSISARVFVALECNKRGESVNAGKALDQLKAILPQPDQRNIDAAFAALDEIR